MKIFGSGCEIRDWDLRLAQDPDLRYLNGHPDVMQIIDSVGEFIPHVLGKLITLVQKRSLRTDPVPRGIQSDARLGLRRGDRAHPPKLRKYASQIRAGKMEN
jgi:hypothetical protein